MTFDDILRPESPKSDHAPVVSRIPVKPQPALPPNERRDERECVPADGAEPHFPRIFPGI